MSDEAAKQKWNKIYAAQCATEIHPANLLVEYAYLLPNDGNALDLACGLGGNAIFLAQHGLNVQAWDISEQAVNKLTQFCKTNEIQLKALVRDVQAQPPTENSFDVICVSYFLERDIANDIIAALKPNGLLYYQTYSREKTSENGPSNPNYRLAENELLNLFSPLHVLSYQELGCVGDIKQGPRDVAYLIAQKR